MTVEELKQLIDLLCKEKITWEQHKGQYDVSDSLMAINAFHAVCHAIDAPDIDGFMRQLREQVEEHQHNLNIEIAGSNNGGRGIWGSCLSSLEQLLKENRDFRQLRWRLRRDIVLIKVGMFGWWGNWRLWLVISFLLTLAWLAII